MLKYISPDPAKNDRLQLFTEKYTIAFNEIKPSHDCSKQSGSSVLKGGYPLDNPIIPHPRGNSQLRNFRFGDIDIYAFDSDGEPYFIAADVCKAIGYVNTSKAVRDYVENEDRGYATIENGTVIGGLTPGYTPGSSLVVNESGLYDLVTSSKKAEAKVFKRWVTHEVLPSIRKTGSYSLQNLTPAEAFLQIAQQMVKTERAIAELHETQAEQAQHIEAIVERIDNSEYFTIRHWCKSQGIRATPAVMQMWGRTASAISRGRGVEIGSITEGNYPVNTYHKSVLSEVCVAKPRSVPGQLRLPRTSGGK